MDPKTAQETLFQAEALSEQSSSETLSIEEITAEEGATGEVSMAESSSIEDASIEGAPAEDVPAEVMLGEDTLTEELLSEDGQSRTMSKEDGPDGLALPGDSPSDSLSVSVLETVAPGLTQGADKQALILGKVLSALKILALEWKTENRLQVLGSSPDWVRQAFEFTCPDNEIFSADTFSSFIDNFLVDAQTFWQTNHSESLRSGVWTESGSSGQEIHLEAIALFLDGRYLILVESSDLMTSERFQWLQIARQRQLDTIEERKIAEAKVRNATFYDALTELPNRSFFLAKLETFFEKSQWSVERQFAIIIINIDRFGHINNNLGSVAGDQIIITVANRIRECLRRNDIAVRFGADEFGILASYTDNEQDVITLVQRLLESIHRPFLIDHQKTYFTASAGIAVQEPWYQNSRDLLRDAGLAMQQAKSFGIGRYAIFQREMRSRAFELWSLESDLHNAIEKGELKLWYQPIVNLNTHKIESFEALIRWQHPSHGWVSPSKFIPLAEETGLILMIDSWVLNTACKALKQWQQVTDEDVQININISAQHFTQGNLVQEVREAIAAAEINPGALRLEITETLLLDDTQRAITTLNHIKALGVEVAIDDFGTGYASLSYLQDLPLNKLKIDGYFIEMMEKNGPEIVNTVIALAHKLGFGVTAERVETVSQYETLRELGCDTVQGYLFSKPVPIVDAQNLIDAEFVISGQSSEGILTK
ncbi:MAG: bifunctional diguanylate cyclase/phosphodiesterase [Cyanobacteria bacterium P01_A01_bin.116]